MPAKASKKSNQSIIRLISSMIEQRYPKSVVLVSSLNPEGPNRQAHRSPRMLVCLSGRAEVSEEGTGLVVEPGDAIFAGPDTTVTPTRLSDCEWMGITFGWKFLKIHRGARTEAADGDPLLILPADRPGEPLRDLLEYVERLTDFERGAYAAPARVFLARLIYIKLLEAIAEQSAPVNAGHGKSRARFLKALEYISENFKDRVTREEVAAYAGVSGAQMNRLFKSHLGKTFIEALNQRRLEYARGLVRNTKIRIRDVALESGFTHPDYFIQVFRKRFRTTPLQMRKQHLRRAEEERKRRVQQPEAESPSG